MPGKEHYIEAISQLLVTIAAKHPPVEVRIEPTPDAEVKNCFYNVQRHVAKMGGEVIYGWAIGVSALIVEAEKHAVWRTHAGTLLDITPRVPVLSSMLFVKDDDFLYTGQYVDSVRLNITTNTVVDDWIRICEGIETLFSFGKRKNEKEIGMPENIVPFLKHLEDLKVKYGVYLMAGGHPGARCFCGRAIIYSDCHGADMVNLENNLVKVREMFST